MFFPIFFNISQNIIEMLEEQCYEMQRRHEEKKWLLAHLEEVAEACYIEYIA